MDIHPFTKKLYPESELLGYTFADGTIAFYTIINNFVAIDEKNQTILDIGCGRGSFMESEVKAQIQLQNFKGRVKKVIGVDIDPAGHNNQSLDEFYILQGDQKWPINDNSIDICICDWVIEHIDNVDFFFSELKRVTKKGAYVCFRTTNKYGYIVTFAKLIPKFMHNMLLRKIQPFRKQEDIFPTVYKCNTKKLFQRYFTKHGFEPYVLYHNTEPNYFQFNLVGFKLGYYLQKILPRSLSTTIFSFGIKKTIIFCLISICS